MAMSFCGKCGEAAPGDDLFCTGCGARLRASVAQARADAAEVSDEMVALKHAVRLMAAGEPGTARAVLEGLVAEQPEWAVARAYLGLAYLRLTRVADARDELEWAVRLAPGSFICHSKYAEFLAQLGFYDQAVRELDLALQIGAPDGGSDRAARELREFSKGKAKGLYYRHAVSPLRFNLKNFWPGRANAAGRPPVIERGI